MDLIKYGLTKVTYPKLEQIEEILKKEGFTVPARPYDRTKQQNPGKANKILMKDKEIISEMLAAAQIAINNHIRAFADSFRDDISKFFKDLYTFEIENLEKIINLAVKRNVLANPPFVTSKQG